MSVIVIILALVLIFVFYVIGIYNRLVNARNKVKDQFSQIDVQLKRRIDLIPNLVETVKGYAKHEQETFTNVMEARAKATQITVDPSNATPEQLAAYQNAQGELSQALGRLLAVAENYPELKANEHFKQLMDQLEGTENRITYARNLFNDTAKEYNTYIRKFPSNIIAGMFGFERKPYFQSEEGADKAPKVEF